ncbi:hypothetical protein FPV14_10620 [Staphylococcus argenteus]|nr:hypothetical protein FPV14_10620 [Staphylococcus argenteus]
MSIGNMRTYQQSVHNLWTTDVNNGFYCGYKVGKVKINCVLVLIYLWITRITLWIAIISTFSM